VELVTSTVANIRGGLATQLKVGSLYTHSTWPGIPTKPCVIVQRCEPEFDQTLGPSTVVRYSVELAVLCLATALIDAQVELDTYLSPTGTASLHAAIQADPTLGGVADSLLDRAGPRRGRNVSQWPGRDRRHCGRGGLEQLMHRVTSLGLTYPTNPDAPRDEWVWKRAETGDEVDDIPAGSLPWLLDGGYVEVVTAPSRWPAAAAPTPEPAVPAPDPVPALDVQAVADSLLQQAGGV